MLRLTYLTCLLCLVTACGRTLPTEPTSKLSESPARSCYDSILQRVAVPQRYQFDISYGEVTSRIVTATGETSSQLNQIYLRPGYEVEIRYSPMLNRPAFAEFLRRNGTAKVTLEYRFDDRDVRSIDLEIIDSMIGWDAVAVGHLLIPNDAKGLLTFNFRMTAPSGESIVDHGEGSAFRASIAPGHATVLCFASDWTVVSDSPIRAGESVTVAYDPTRVVSLLQGSVYNGSEVWSAVAWVKFLDADHREIGRDFQFVKATNSPPLLASLPVHRGAASVEVWFEAGASGGMVYDSDYGRNFGFPVVGRGHETWNSTTSNTSTRSPANVASPAPLAH